MGNRMRYHQLEDRSGPYAVICPTCYARAGSPCRWMGTLAYIPRRNPHLARWEAAE